MTAVARSSPISRRQRRRREADQRLEIGDARPQRRVAVPDRCALLGERLGIGEAAGVEGERPAVGLGQMGEALHRRAFEALADHLIEGEQAALARPRPVGEGDRRRIHAARQRRVGAAGRRRGRTAQFSA